MANENVDDVNAVDTESENMAPQVKYLTKSAVSLTYSLAIGVLVAIAVAVGAGIVITRMIEPLSASVANGVIWSGAVVGLLAASSVHNFLSSLPPEQSRHNLIWPVRIIWILCSARAFFWLVYPVNNSWILGSPYNTGDLGLHLGFIRYMGSGIDFWKENPLLTGEMLHYPVGMDFFNCMLVLLGMDVFQSFVVVGFGMSLLTLLCLERWGGSWAVAAFLFCGGTAGFLIFKTGQLMDYQYDVEWKSLFLSLFVTQRGLLFAIPAGLTILYDWRHRFAPEPAPRLPLLWTTLLYIAMPIFHLHTFLFLSLLLLWIFIFGNHSIKVRSAGLVLFTFVPASYFVLSTTSIGHGASMFHWHPGWMMKESDTLFFWLQNFGLWLLLLFWLTGIVIYKFIKKQPFPNIDFACIFAVIITFLLCSFISFAPWPWDNTKLYLWAYLCSLPFLWKWLLAPLDIQWRALLILMFLFSGAISTLGGLHVDTIHPRLANRRELDHIMSVLNRIPPEQGSFLTLPTYNHPVFLAGRPISVAYPGHLWSHGYDYTEKENAVRSVLKGDQNWQQSLKLLNPRYIFWGTREAEAYPHSTRPWLATSTPIANGEWGTLYRINDTEPEPEKE